MKVLSLFDGMSCGQIALDQLGIPIDTYYASEIDKYAIQVAQANYPNTIQVGDICNLDPKDYQDVELIFAGSPCQGFSFAGKQLAFDDPRSALFFEFVRLLKAIKPKYFLLENVRMKKEFLDIISEQVSECYPEIPFGVEPILINSSLVSAQSRQRYYWTNIPGVKQPKERGIVLKDILETETNEQSVKDTERNRRHYKHEHEKSLCMSATMWKGAGNNGMTLVPNKQYISKQSVEKYVEDVNAEFNDPYNKKTVKGDKSTTLRTNSSNGNMWVNDKAIKETKPKQVGVAVDINGHDVLKRVYSPDGKSPTVNTCQGGNREPKVAQDNLTWRKLTPMECERLQTVPDNYTNHVSNTQRYKMLGNGWTVEVIKHILRNMDTNNEN